MKKLLITFTLGIYLLMGNTTTVPHTKEKSNVKEQEVELHMHLLRREDVEKILGAYDYLSEQEGEII